MRYYALTLSNAKGQIYKVGGTGDGFTLGTGGNTFSSITKDSNGKIRINPGALNIEFDWPVFAYQTPQGRSLIRVSGIGLKMIGQSANLNGANFTLAAGMQKGLPLANPAQAGVIAKGQIFQAFGNWQGINQTLELICGPGQVDPQGGVAFQWKVGQSLKSALSATLSQAFPGYKQNINVSANLQPPKGADQAGTYDSLQQFAQYLNDMTQPLGAEVTGNPNYRGVSITTDGATINVFDGTVPQKTVQLAFQDLVGQPTWLGPAEISVKTVLRADINIGDTIMFPNGVIPPYAVTSASAAYPGAPSRSQSIFKGGFFVTEIHYYANFRQPDGDSWCTVYNAVPIGPTT